MCERQEDPEACSFNFTLNPKENEVKNLCSRQAKSMQKLHNASTLRGFNWDSVIEEATEHAPNLIQLLKECTRKSPKQPEAEQKSMVGLTLSSLCKHRNPKMALFQRIVSCTIW